MADQANAQTKAASWNITMAMDKSEVVTLGITLDTRSKSHGEEIMEAMGLGRRSGSSKILCCRGPRKKTMTSTAVTKSIAAQLSWDNQASLASSVSIALVALLLARAEVAY